MLNLNSHTIFDTKSRSLEDGIQGNNSFQNNHQGILKNKDISDWWTDCLVLLRLFVVHFSHVKAIEMCTIIYDTNE